MGLMLLLMHVENGVDKRWKRIPTVCAYFAAVTSLILLDSSHELYAPINKLLKSSSTLNLKVLNYSLKTVKLLSFVPNNLPAFKLFLIFLFGREYLCFMTFSGAALLSFDHRGFGNFA